MLPLKIILSAHFQWLLRLRNDWHLTPPSSRNKVRSHVQHTMHKGGRTPRTQHPCIFTCWLLCIHCPYNYTSRTTLLRHTDRALIEESVYQFWSKTGKNGWTCGATGVDLLTIFFYRHGKLELCVLFAHH